MSDSANVNFDPYASNLAAIINAAIKKYFQQFQTCIPAIVKEVVSRDTVIVIPAVQQIDSKWKSVPWASIKLPVCTPGGNKVFQSWPLAAGDTGWIIAGDLDPSLFFKDTSRPQRQNLMNRHEYQFGFFVPDMINGYSVSADDDGQMVISTTDGKNKIVLGDNGLKIKADSVIIETTDGASVTIDGTDWKTHTHDTTAGVGDVVVDTNTGANTSPLTWTSSGVN